MRRILLLTIFFTWAGLAQAQLYKLSNEPDQFIKDVRTMMEL